VTAPLQLTFTGSPTINIGLSAQELAAILAGINHLETHMSELDDRLADLKAATDTNTAKLATLIADFEAAGTLTPAQQAALDALKAEVVGNSAAIDAADPNAATPPAP
jgi:peptidoglycan hydrolase CwlO-like protein